MNQSLSPILRAALFPSIFEANSVGAETIPIFLKGKSFSLNKLNPILRIAIDESTLKEIIANEIVRFSSASAESLTGILQNPIFPKSAGWDIVRMYYAAYYASHSLMRLFGFVCTRIEDIHRININEMARSVGIQEQITSGIFFGDIDKFGNLNLELHSNSNVHQTFWKVFHHFLGEVGKKIELLKMNNQFPVSDIELVSSYFSKMQSSFAKDPGWLSTIRNNTNYKLDYGLWHPYIDSKLTHKKIKGDIKKFQVNSQLNIQICNVHDLDDFLKCTNGIISLNSHILFGLSNVVKKQNFIKRFLFEPMKMSVAHFNSLTFV